LKHIKRIICMVLTMVILAAIIPAPAVGAAEFSDLAATHWAHTEIVNLAQQGVISGFPDGTYRPDDPVTREQFARLVATLLGEPVDREAIFTEYEKENLKK